MEKIIGYMVDALSLSVLRLPWEQKVMYVYVQQADGMGLLQLVTSGIDGDRNPMKLDPLSNSTDVAAREFLEGKRRHDTGSG